MRLRITNSLRSNAFWSATFSPRPINTWRITGSTSFAACAMLLLSRGTSRQPKSVCASSWMMRATIDSQASRPFLV